MTMRRSKLVAVAAVASLGALGIAFAEIDSSKDHHDGHAEAAFVQTAKHSLIDAIITAEKRAKGFATEAALEMEDGNPVYEIETISKSGSFEARIDAETGIVLEARPEDGTDDPLSVIENLPQRMVAAIEAAEAKTGDAAMEAELENQSGRHIFEVELASSDGQVTHVTVDARTGEVQVSPEDEDSENDD